jgi:hypothetical protein
MTGQNSKQKLGSGFRVRGSALTIEPGTFNPWWFMGSVRHVSDSFGGIFRQNEKQE